MRKPRIRPGTRAVRIQNVEDAASQLSGSTLVRLHARQPGKSWRWGQVRTKLILHRLPIWQNEGRRVWIVPDTTADAEPFPRVYVGAYRFDEAVRHAQSQ